MVGLCKVCLWLGFFPPISRSLPSSASRAPLKPLLLSGHRNLWAVHFWHYLTWPLCSLDSVAILFSSVFCDFPPVFLLPPSLLPNHLVNAAVSGVLALDLASFFFFFFSLSFCVLSLSNHILSNIYRFVNFQYQGHSWAPDLHTQVL